MVAVAISLFSVISVFFGIAEKLIPSFRLRIEYLEGTEVGTRSSRAAIYRIKW